jgi:hypothetical protein
LADPRLAILSRDIGYLLKMSEVDFSFKGERENAYWHISYSSIINITVIP